MIADDDVVPSPGPGGSTSVPDTVKPKLLASAKEIKRKGLRKRGLRVRFSCNEACTVNARLLVGKRVIATRTTKLAAAGSSALRLKPTKKAFATIGDRKRVKVSLAAADAAGNTSKYAFRVRLL